MCLSGRFFFCCLANLSGKQTFGTVYICFNWFLLPLPIKCEVFNWGKIYLFAHLLSKKQKTVKHFKLPD